MHLKWVGVLQTVLNFLQQQSNLQEGAFSSRAFAFEICWDYHPSSSSPAEHLTVDPFARLTGEKL